MPRYYSRRRSFGRRWTSGRWSKGYRRKSFSRRGGRMHYRGHRRRFIIAGQRY